MKKSYKKFFLPAILFLILIFSATGVKAYEIPSGGSSSTSSQSNFGSGYSFGNSFNNLFSPFENLFSGISQSNNSVNLPELPQNDYKVSVGGNTFDLQGLLKKFDDWFYGLTGIRLSGIIFVILKGFSWILGLVKQFVDWLLGFFHG